MSVSILMPLYNGSEFLSESIPSVIAQTHQKWELLVAINGHDEKSAAEIIKKLKSFKDNRIKYMICPAKGKTKALNRAVQFAKYKLICLLDVDDLWLPTKLEEQLAVIDKYDVVGTDIEYFGEKSGSPNLFLGRLSRQMFSWQNSIISSTVMMKKSDSCWKKEHDGLEDFHLWIDLLQKGKTFYNVPKVLANHRIHQASYFNNKNKEAGDQASLQRLPRLTDEEMIHLTDVIDNKKWEI